MARRCDAQWALAPSQCLLLLVATLPIQGAAAAILSSPTYHSTPPTLNGEGSPSALQTTDLSSAGRRWGLLPECRVHSVSGGTAGDHARSWAKTVNLLRGGATDDDDETTDSEEYDDDEEDSVFSSDSEEDEEEYNEYEEEDDEEDTRMDSDLGNVDQGKIEYDTPYAPSFVQQMGSSIGVMVLCRKIDLFDPKVVRMVRFAFISYAVITQLFLAYVRIRAKIENDRTPITIKNPVSSLLQKQLPESGGGTNDMVKNIASQFLSSQSSVMEYDLKEAKKMGNSLLFPLAILWFMHFKLGQVQPLLFQISSGVVNLLYSPLFQVYVLGRNLERPFKSPSNPMVERMEELQKQQNEAAEAAEEGASGGADDVTAGVEDNAAGESAGKKEVEEGDTDVDEYDEASEAESEEEDSSDYDSDVDE